MNMKKVSILSIIIIVFLAIGCSQNVSTPAEEEGKSEKVEKKEAESTSKLIIKGKILETQDAANYTYLLLSDGNNNEMWAAIPKTKLEIGEVVVLENGTMMNNFSSKSLNKVFDKIIFASGVAKDETVSAIASNKNSIAAGSGGSDGNTMEFAGIKVKKADAGNAYSVVEVFAKSKDLNSQKVTVRGKVVKVSNNIMGKNWLHIQDGTGNVADKSHDLVITTLENVEIGEIVAIEGILAANKDFGYGYKYVVIIEDAKVIK